MNSSIWVVLTILACTIAQARGDEPVGPAGHPRLYVTAAELPRLRERRATGVHAMIWKNLISSADWCLTLEPRTRWIEPVAPDPRYENLYDRFYAIMRDLAVTEHLAFAYALSGDARYGDAARRWILASCRVWQWEAEGTPDGAKAYAVARLLKGIAVGYDLAFDRLGDDEKREVRTTLVRIGNAYYAGYFATPTIAGPGFSTHHAAVEWGSFGVLALALLGDVPEADLWLKATIKKFDEQLLPNGLATDGAQIEGPTFWASTMHYRLFFLDPLRRVTGLDLFRKHERAMNADLALASIAARKRLTYDQEHANVVLEPSYGQLDYYAPLLLYLAREYRHPTFQHLALWDETLGGLQKTRYVTPHGEALLFELGGYAYLWYDPLVHAKADEPRLSFRFPSVGEAYARASWQPDDLLVGVRKGEVVVHAGGRPVLIEPMTGREPAVPLAVDALDDDGRIAVIRCSGPGGRLLTVELNRPERKLIVRRRGAGAWRWWCQGNPQRSGNRITWGPDTSVQILEGEIRDWQPDGYATRVATGFDRLVMVDPASRTFPLVSVQPSQSGELVVEVKGAIPMKNQD
jgi:Domain of unknown function (DUF4962)